MFIRRPSNLRLLLLVPLSPCLLGSLGPRTNFNERILAAQNRERNALSQKELMARPEFGPIRAQILEVLNSKDRIPYIARRGDWVYNFWQDEAHRKGLWRRTTLAEYRKLRDENDASFRLQATLDDAARTRLGFDLYGTINFGSHVGVQGGYRSLSADYLVDQDAGDLKMKGFYFGGLVRF